MSVTTRLLSRSPESWFVSLSVFAQIERKDLRQSTPVHSRAHSTGRYNGKENVADFVFRFRATCLKIPDLSEAEKMDRFVHALLKTSVCKWS